MANVTILDQAEGCLAVWTDARRGDRAYSRRNVFAIGSRCVVLHDSVEAWLPAVRPLLAPKQLAALEVGPLAERLREQLSSLTDAPGERLGVIVAGFESEVTPLMLGLHSARGFSAQRFGPWVIGGLPSNIYDYISSNLRTIAPTREAVVDRLLLAADAYASRVLVPSGEPADSEVAILERGRTLAWLGEAEIEAARERNRRRVAALQVLVTRSLLERSR